MPRRARTGPARAGADAHARARDADRRRLRQLRRPRHPASAPSCSAASARGPQVQALRRNVDIVVATPGRLLDLMEQGHARFDACEVLVLDEADRMLDMGFIDPIRRIIAALPRKRQNLMFSATMPPEIAQLARRILVDPVNVAVTPVSSTVELITQWVLHVDRGDKRALLREVLRDPEDEARAGVHAHQARRQQRRRGAGPQRRARRRDSRQQVAGRAPARAGLVQAGRHPRAGRDRHRRARHRRRRHHAT